MMNEKIYNMTDDEFERFHTCTKSDYILATGIVGMNLQTDELYFEDGSAIAYSYISSRYNSILRDRKLSQILDNI